MMKFAGKILVIGCGSVSQCAIPLVLKIIDAPPKNITIMDFTDNRHRVKDSLDKGVNYVIERVTRKNYPVLLKKYAGAGDLIIDLAWNIDCIEILQWARDNKVLYVNTSVEVWDPYSMDVRDPRNLTLYVRQMEIRNLIKKWGDNNGPTAVVDHGANPGLVSHFTKVALEDIAKKIISDKPKDKRVKILKEALDNKNYPALAKTSGVKVIHISERDTQISDKPKEVDEFVNTWSIEGFFEEGIAPAEMGWGTHEKNIPEGAYFHKSGPKNQICLESMGVNTWVRSWVPDCEIVGMVIRHGEAFGISDRLTVWDKKSKAIYRPTVHYAYCPADAAIISLHELEMRRYNLQENQRIMNNEITKGEDRLGVLLMGHDFNSWWTGSLLDIEEARKLVPNQNATTLQVAISVVAAARWMIENPNKGFNLPDDLPHEDIMKISRPYLGPFISIPVDWTPLKNYNKTFRTLGLKKPKAKDQWQFTTFLITQS
ncbi:MAG: homospermidine synthase [Candidatus Omnitrophica bacterium CG_4_9_14_0_2_um_filter_42_8]|nr:MAG: homospermidine synthase [Candidatus Omnitrophica bacterium CG22_combo_CG10-13_8_21_14_all_43_16]PJC46988.1 MAG: homospermidine synthase [Candidatus Omnitrophica bacterium CG_4_9_14_0_2_um_filter_42_8]